MKSVFLSLILFFSLNFSKTNASEEKNNRNIFCMRTINNRQWLWCCLAENENQCIYKRGKNAPTKFLINAIKHRELIYTEIEYVNHI